MRPKKKCPGPRGIKENRIMMVGIYDPDEDIMVELELCPETGIQISMIPVKKKDTLMAFIELENLKAAIAFLEANKMVYK